MNQLAFPKQILCEYEVSNPTSETRIFKLEYFSSFPKDKMIAIDGFLSVTTMQIIKSLRKHTAPKTIKAIVIECDKTPDLTSRQLCCPIQVRHVDLNQRECSYPIIPESHLHPLQTDPNKIEIILTNPIGFHYIGSLEFKILPKSNMTISLY